LLVAEPGRTRYGRDGGEELQVNEVIVGSAWIFVTCLRQWGLIDEAAVVAGSLDNHARRTGLQFRTPAAWTDAGLFSRSDQHAAARHLEPDDRWA
jgi:non-lysosomal glucosylceramidase